MVDINKFGYVPHAQYYCPDTTQLIELQPLLPITSLPHHLKSILQARINLVRGVLSRIRIPDIAELKDIGVEILLDDFLGLLENLQEQAAAHVPSEMAMQGPSSRVVLHELQHHEGRLDGAGDVARVLHLVHVAALRVGGVGHGAVPLAVALGENVVVVAVEMHGVAADEAVVDEVDADVFCAGELVHVPFGLEVGLAVLGLEEHRRVVVAAVSAVVEIPDEVCAVGLELEVDALDVVGCLEGNLAKWDADGQVVVLALLKFRGGDGGGGGWNSIGIGVFVVHGCESVGRHAVVERATEALGELGTHPESVAWLADGFHDDISTLADGNGDYICCVRLDGDKVDGDDLQLMAVDAELLDTFSTSVDKTQKMLLSRLELELGNTSVGRAWPSSVRTGVVHATVDEIVVRWREATIHGSVHERVVIGMEPILKNDWTNIDIVFLVTRSVDDHGTVGTARVLGAVMA